MGMFSLLWSELVSQLTLDSGTDKSYTFSQMTDSTVIETSAPRPGKRERLVAAARELVYRHGVVRTTLADIAAAADVPVGNVYYYFKTKDDIIDAVVQAHADQLSSAITALERKHRSPKARLKGLVANVLTEPRELVAHDGCPYGTLSSELAEQPDGSDPLAAPLMQIPLDWAEQQFRAMGRRDARDLAVELVVAFQGTAVVASSGTTRADGPSNPTPRKVDRRTPCVSSQNARQKRSPVVTDLAPFAELVPRDHGLCVLSTLRRDGSVHSSVINAGVLPHPLTGEQVVGLVAIGGSRKLDHLRADPRATIVARAGWQWAAVEGNADIIGPDDPHPDVDGEALRLLLRGIFKAAGGTHDDYDTYDRVMAEERRAAVLIPPTRTYTNPG
jgi:PPOX class probable F420-dependent enzyme